MDGIDDAARAAQDAPAAAGHHVQHADRGAAPPRRSTRCPPAPATTSTKPANVGSVAESIRSVREQLIPRIHALRRPPAAAAAPAPAPAGPAGRPAHRPARRRRATGAAPGRRPAGPRRTRHRRPPARRRLRRAPRPPAAGADRPRPAAAGPTAPRAGPRPRRGRGGRVDVLAIGCSTGGPDALARVVQRAARRACRCRSSSCSTCRRSSPGCSPSGSTAAAR